MDWGLDVGTVRIYYFGGLIALFSLLALVYADRRMKKNGLKNGTGALSALLCTLFAVLGARALYCLCIVDYLEGVQDWAEIFRLSNGGYALWGAVLGALAGAGLTAKITRQPWGKIADCLALPACLLIAAGRIASVGVGQSLGMTLDSWFDPWETDPASRFSLFALEDDSFFRRLPFAVEMDEEWRWAIFVLEAIAAVFMFVFIARKKGLRPGGQAMLFVLLYAGLQIPMEAMKRVSVLRLPFLSFVRANQVFCALTLLTLLIVFLWKIPKEQRKKLFFPAAVKILLGALIVTAMEFAAFEKKITQISWMPADICHLIMAAGSVLMISAVYPAWKRLYKKDQKRGGIS